MDSQHQPIEHRLTVSNLFLLTAAAAALAVSMDSGALALRLDQAPLTSPSALIPLGVAGTLGGIVGLVVGLLRDRSLFGALAGGGVGWLAGLYVLTLFAAPASGLRIASGAMIVCLAPLIVRSSVD